MTKGHWFLPPDFTFRADGPLRLGTILPYPTRPTLVLASPDEIQAEIQLPPTSSDVVEPNHAHGNKKGYYAGFGLLARFVDVVTGSASLDFDRRNAQGYSSADHQVHSFTAPVSKAAAKTIVALPDVRKHIDGGLFGKRPVYIVSGLRVAVGSYTVTYGKEANHSAQAQVGAGVPDAGLQAAGRAGVNSANTGSYNTAPNTIFAYRLHVIRPKGTNVETELFSHRTAFLTGEGGANDDEYELEVAEVTPTVLDDDLEEQVNVREEAVGEDEYCIIPYHIPLCLPYSSRGSDAAVLRLCKRITSHFKAKAHTDNYGKQAVYVASLEPLASNKDNAQQVREGILDALKATTGGRKRIVDSVRQQAAFNFLLEEPDTPLHVFSPDMVMLLNDARLEAIAGEDAETARRRQALAREIESLELGVKILRS
ncbi:hypothetical protein RB595_010415 [Gaeumannomyces hyphopodioides]